MKLYTANEIERLYDTWVEDGCPKPRNYGTLKEWIKEQKRNKQYCNLSVPAFRLHTQIEIIKERG